MLTELELTTDKDQYRAYMYSTPTVIDLDADGLLEIIVGSSVGNVHVISSKGEMREGFPVEVGEVQGQVTVEDIDGDGKLDLIVCDGNSNIVAFSSDGVLLWDKQLAGFSAHVSPSSIIYLSPFSFLATPPVFLYGVSHVYRDLSWGM